MLAFTLLSFAFEFLWRKFEISIRNYLMPVIYILCGLILIFVVNYLIPSSNSLTSSESSGMRIAQWYDTFSEFLKLDIVQQVFGAGKYQGENGHSLIIDNMYIAVLYNMGVFGLTTWILLIYLYIKKLRSLIAGKYKYQFDTLVCLWLFAMLYNLSVGIFEIGILICSLVYFGKYQKEIYESSRPSI
ncbi:hypothetical protein [Deinococcus ruber]|uniref:O-antigen polymerase n=1 Tax=Deinococcus ruber TaxID=1848197 RepID=A0A918C6R5_9DEIO|nr:hypothetical protein [Deinococcus ruber]GGR08711.1 hypothetical protein GCM10008957_21870 [Deinococcus ruber]